MRIKFSLLLTILIIILELVVIKAPQLFAVTATINSSKQSESVKDNVDKPIQSLDSNSNEGFGLNKKVILTIIGAIIGFLFKTLWDYIKTRIIHNKEIEKITINFFFEIAKNHYFGIYHYIDYLKDDIQKLHDQKKPDEIMIIYAFYNLAQYLRELSKLNAKAGFVWFFTKLDKEKR